MSHFILSSKLYTLHWVHILLSLHLYCVWSSFDATHTSWLTIFSSLIFFNLPSIPICWCFLSSSHLRRNTACLSLRALVIVRASCFSIFLMATLWMAYTFSHNAGACSIIYTSFLECVSMRYSLCIISQEDA